MKQTLSNPLLRTLDGFLEGRTAGWIVNVAVIPIFILIALVLPPIAIPSRILSAGYTGISPAVGGTVSISDGAQFSVPKEIAKNAVSIRLTSQARDSFMKSSLAKNLPATLDVKSPMYAPSMQGAPPSLSLLSLPIPDGADPLSTLTVYGYVAKKWTKLPFQIYIDDQRVETYLGAAIPEAVVIAQTQAQTPTLTGDLPEKDQLPSQVAQLIAEVTPGGFTIADDGSINGSIAENSVTDPSSPYQVLPTLTNVIGDQIRGDWVDDTITNVYSRQQHINAIVDLITERLYPGINIDYQNVSPSNRSAYSAFISELAKALQDKNKILAVTLPMPTQLAIDNWETDAYDWAEIGLAADIVTIPIQVTRDAYVGDNPIVQSYLTWAVGRIDHFKLQVAVSMLGRDEFGTLFAPLGFGSALKLMGPISVPASVSSGDKVTLDLQRLRESGGLRADAVTGLYSYNYRDDKGSTHTVYIENAESLAKKMALALQYNLRGIVLKDLSADSVDPRVWDALKRYRDGEAPAYKGTLAIVWRVNGQSIGKSQVNDPKTTWTASDQPGDEKVEAVLSFDGGQSIAGSAGVVPIQVAKAAAPTARPTTAALAPSSAPRPTTAAARPPAAPAPPSNLPGYFAYGAQLNWTNRDNSVAMGDLNGMGFTWAKVQVRWCDFEGSPGNIGYGQMDQVIAAAGAKGIKVMFSVVCAPNWSRADGGRGGSGPPDDMQKAADFMANIAGKYCGGALGAIEVWNEHNLLTEWHGKSISAALYLDMLKKTYPAIKARCPAMVVVSGAPTPTGVMSDTAIDDVVFLQQMYANGLRGVSDAIGAHPSGFCNAPDASEGMPNPCGGQYNNHRSFFLKRTLEEYRKVMVANGDGGKRIWPTEFGWGVDPAPKPGYEYERALNDDTQAKWLVGAYQLMKSMGYVGVAILWNLDFTDMGNETGAFHVLGRAAQGALAGMPK